jgi:hypothetical protein
LARYLNPSTVEAVRGALALVPVVRPEPARLGLFTATGPSRFDPDSLGARLDDLDAARDLWGGSLAHVDPFSLLKMMNCGALAVLALALSARGPSAHFCDDALGGVVALYEARAALLRGEIDAALVLAFDDLSSPHAQAEVSRAGLAGPLQQRAAAYLLREPDASLAELSAVSICYHDDPAAPVGGGAALAQLLGPLARGETPREVRARCAAGEATILLR